MHPGAFPTDELDVIPWFSRYLHYALNIYWEGNAHKFNHIQEYLPASIYTFVKDLTTWEQVKECILGLAGPSGETAHAMVKKLEQKQGEHCHAFCRHVLEICGQVGRDDAASMLNVY